MLDLQTLCTETEMLRALEQLRADLASFWRATRCKIRPRPRKCSATPSPSDDHRLLDRTFIVDLDALDTGRRADENHTQLPLPGLA